MRKITKLPNDPIEILKFMRKHCRSILKISTKKQSHLRILITLNHKTCIRIIRKETFKYLVKKGYIALKNKTPNIHEPTTIISVFSITQKGINKIQPRTPEEQIVRSPARVRYSYSSAEFYERTGFYGRTPGRIYV